MQPGVIRSPVHIYHKCNWNCVEGRGIGTKSERLLEENRHAFSSESDESDADEMYEACQHFCTIEQNYLKHSYRNNVVMKNIYFVKR